MTAKKKTTTKKATAKRKAPAKKNTGENIGRPTRYGRALLNKAQKYLKIYSEELGEALPTITGLCVYLNIARSTVYKWKDDQGKEEFSDILEKIECRQEIKLVSLGLLGTFNSTITKMMLTKHGYSDKQELEVSTPDNIIDAILRGQALAK